MPIGGTHKTEEIVVSSDPSQQQNTGRFSRFDLWREIGTRGNAGQAWRGLRVQPGVSATVTGTKVHCGREGRRNF